MAGISKDAPDMRPDTRARRMSSGKAAARGGPPHVCAGGRRGVEAQLSSDSPVKEETGALRAQGGCPGGC